MQVLTAGDEDNLLVVGSHGVLLISVEVGVVIKSGWVGFARSVVRATDGWFIMFLSTLL